MKIADLMAKVLLHVSQQLMEDPRLPADVKESMKNVQALVSTLKSDLNKDVTKLKSMEKQAQGLGKNLQDLKKLPDAGKDLQKTEKDLQSQEKGLQDMGKNLLGGSKTTQPK